MQFTFVCCMKFGTIVYLPVDSSLKLYVKFVTGEFILQNPGCENNVDCSVLDVAIVLRGRCRGGGLPFSFPCRFFDISKTQRQIIGQKCLHKHCDLKINVVTAIFKTKSHEIEYTSSYLVVHLHKEMSMCCHGVELMHVLEKQPNFRQCTGYTFHLNDQ